MKRGSGAKMTENALEYLHSQGMMLPDIQKYTAAGFAIEETAEAVKCLADRGESWRDTDSDFCPEPASSFGDDTTGFVWRPYIPKGDYSVLMADGGTGKTIFCCGIAAAISTGAYLPGCFAKAEPQNVLIISAEDRGELLKRRLSACGADLTRVFILDCGASVGLNFAEGIDGFEAVIKRCKPALVIVDPWHAFLGAETDINRVNAVRPVFQRLANAAKNCDCGLILVSHVNKRAQGENANNAATGSTDFINAARSAMRVVFDDDDENGRIVVHTKSNYAAAGRSVKYRITDQGGLVWTGFSDITRQTLEEAARWRKKPSEVLAQHHEDEVVNADLIEAVVSRANPDKPVNVSYAEMRGLYGDYIFGGKQPKRALDGILADLHKRGVNIVTGKTVRYDGRTENGFSVITLAQNADDEPGEEEPL